MQRIKFLIKHLSNFAHKNLIMVKQMTETNIIIYRGFNVETTNFGNKLVNIEVIGNWTGKYEDAKTYGIPHRAEKLSADILKVESEKPWNMKVHLQDEKFIHMGITEQNFSSIDECIEYMKKCIDRYLFRE